jgi:hypothetical protein
MNFDFFLNNEICQRAKNTFCANYSNLNLCERSMRSELVLRGLIINYCHS